MPDPSVSLLDPILVARLATMELCARAVVEGTLAGRHRGRRRGRALEYSGHRPYSPSDDARWIDWRSYARTDRFVVREAEEETNRRVFLLLDASASMGFHGPGRITKLRCGAILLAAMAYALIRQGEAVGVGIFDEGLGDFLAPRAGKAHLSLVLDLLDRAKPAGGTRLDEALDEAAGRLPGRTWVILAGDFWSGAYDPMPALRRLRARRHEAAVLMPLDPLETDLDLEGDFHFRDVETGEGLRTSAGDLREAYRTLAAGRFGRLEKSLASLRVPAVRCMTDRPLDESLRRFLEAVS